MVTLGDLEAVLADRWASAASHGAALAAIRDQAMTGDFRAYLSQRWGLSEDSAARLISHAAGYRVADPPIPSPQATVFYDGPRSPLNTAGGNAGLGVPWVVPAYLVPSLGGTGYDDAGAISTALAGGGGVCHLLPASYHTSSAIQLPVGPSSLVCEGQAVINCASTTGDGIQGTDVSSVTLRGLYLIGPSSGSGQGIGLGISANSNLPYLHLEDLRIAHFGGDGVNIQAGIVSGLKNVNSFLNGGNGFTLSAAVSCTSTTFQNCYANANTGNGYALTNCHYCSLNGCASDNNGNAYVLTTCVGTTVNGCGFEAATTDGYVISGGSANSILGSYSFHNNHYAIHVTGNALRTTIGGFTEATPQAGAVNAVITDAGTTGVVWGVTHATADSIGGTWTNVDGSA